MATCSRCGVVVDDQMASCPSCGCPKAVSCPGCSVQYRVGPEHFRGGNRFEFKCPHCQTLVAATNPSAPAPAPEAPAATREAQPLTSQSSAPTAHPPQTTVTGNERPTGTGPAPKKKLGMVPKVGIGLGIGCGGLVALFLLLGILGGLLDYSSGNRSGNESTASGQERLGFKLSPQFERILQTGSILQDSPDSTLYIVPRQTVTIYFRNKAERIASEIDFIMDNSPVQRAGNLGNINTLIKLQTGFGLPLTAWFRADPASAKYHMIQTNIGNGYRVMYGYRSEDDTYFVALERY